jgi:hypothetical protein
VQLFPGGEANQVGYLNPEHNYKPLLRRPVGSFPPRAYPKGLSCDGLCCMESERGAVQFCPGGRADQVVQINLEQKPCL